MFKTLNINTATDLERVKEILAICEDKDMSEKHIYDHSPETRNTLFSLHEEIKRQLGSVLLTDYSAILSFVCTLDDARHIYCIALCEREVYIMEDSRFPYNPDTIKFIGYISKKEDWKMFWEFVSARWGYPRMII